MTQREIKFRAWDGAKMIKPESPFEGAGSGAFEYSVGFNGNPYLFSVWGFEPSSVVNDCILMQYTGHKDKHGKGIYEGDVVSTARGLRYKIEYDDEDACFYLKPIYGVSSKENFHFYEIDFEKVIGNIYENPELLN